MRRRTFLKAGVAAVAGAASLSSAASEGRSALAASAPGVPVLDCHAHVGSAHLNGTADDLTDPWDTLADAQQILRHAQQAGIDRTVICSIECVTYERANEEVAALCHRHPQNFIGSMRHHPTREKGHLRELMLREYHELGLRGLGEIHEQPSAEMLDIARELGIPVLYHPARVALYEEFLPSYPSVPFILAHLGSDQSEDWREHLAAIELAGRYPNVYLDTSTVVTSWALERALRELPSEKLVFGSDEPECDSRLELFKIKAQGLPAEQQERVLGSNLLRLLGGKL